MKYVVSADIYLLLKKWAKQKSFILPTKEFFDELRKEFSNYMFQIFPDFEFISEEEILGHMQMVTESSNLPCVSLDPVYFPCDFSIELTRKIDLQGVNKGLQSRFGSYSLLKQLNQLKSHGIKEVCLVDDVIFSGVFMMRVFKLLSRIGIRVPIICAGIGIQNGINLVLNPYVNPKIEIHCSKVYNEVIDEVCERDFYLGIPFSGRSLTGSKNIGLPYILPFGEPEEWASIPKSFRKAFSRFCINQTIILFKEIEKSSSKAINCSDIERKVIGQPESGSYIDFLKSISI
ncbi:MAG: hypothetical protein AAB477_00135 [Patescibacteria group bacterium]